MSKSPRKMSESPTNMCAMRIHVREEIKNTYYLCDLISVNSHIFLYDCK